MPLEKSLAIVLRVVEFSETSCVVTLFTRDFGKISALAKGARRPKSSFEAALDLLSLCRIVFLHKSTDVLDLLTEAKLERCFRAGARELPRLYAGYYVDELLNELTDTGDPHPDLFDSATETLRKLDTDGDPFATLLRFELTALRHVGHLPEFEMCVACGGGLKGERRESFAPLAGGVVCGDCRFKIRPIVSVARESLALFRRYAEEGDAWREVDIRREWRGEIRGVLNHFLSGLLGRRPRMYQYLNMLAD